MVFRRTRNKKIKNQTPAQVAARLREENARLSDRIHNQREVISHSIGTSTGTDPQTVSNRALVTTASVGQQTPVRMNRTLGRNVYAEGGMLSNREYNLLWRELGNTDDGRAFAMAALHPCAENLPPVQGIPDRTAIPIATPSYRNTSTIAMPAGLSTTNWDVQIVFLPIPEVDYIWRARASAGAEWGRWQLVRPAAFPGSANGTAVTLGSVGYTKYRLMGRGYTLHHLASALANQGLCVAGQISAINVDFDAVSVDNATTSNNTVNETNFRIPSGTQQLVQMDNLSTEWNAPHGVYMPLRYDQTVELYRVAAGGDSVTTTDDPVATVPRTYATVTSATTEGGAESLNLVDAIPTPTFTMPDNGFPDANQLIYGASQAANQLVGVVFFTGISLDATIQVKSRTHIEAQAATDGYAIQPFVHSSPVMDEKAMNMVATIGQVQKHAYYACYNDLGSMMKSIWNALWPIGKSLVSGGASLIPGVGGSLSSSLSRIKNPFAGTDWWSNL
jgi:hypothetical protein